MPAAFRETLRALLLSAAAAVTLSAPAAAQQETQSDGLPMWVIRDDDSTIYVTGTVHVLPDDIGWRSEKLDAALAEASELWLEIAEIGDPRGLNATLLATYGDRLASDGPSLSSRLTEEERDLLAAAIRDAETPPEIAARIDNMKAFYAIYAIDRAHQLGGDYRGRNGVDRVLGGLALAQGHSVKGLETLEFQIGDAFETPEDIQLAALRERLRSDTPEQRRLKRMSDLAYLDWARGKTHMVEALAALMYVSPDKTFIHALLRDRNENWAVKIEDMLEGKGVSFVAVGALHLVGPDSLQKRLELRGIKSSRY